MKSIISFLILFLSINFYAQNSKAPVYPTCEETEFENLETCFIESLKADFLKEFKLPSKKAATNFKGKIMVLFSISTSGNYHINYINANSPSIKEEIIRVFSKLPIAKPAMYNGHAIESDYIFI